MQNHIRKTVGNLMYGSLLCLVLLGEGCTSSQHPDNPIVHVDLDAEEPQDSAKNVFSITQVVPLQADGQLSSVDKLEQHDSLIYVLDQKQMALFIFNEEGVLRQTVKKIGRASGEYLSLDDFAVDDNGCLYLFDSSSQRISCYDALGKTYSHKIDVCAGTGFTLYGSDLLVVHCNILGEHNLAVFKKDGTKVKEIPFPQEIPNMLVSNGGCIFEHDGSLFFTNPFFYTLYTVDGEQAKPLYTFDFGTYNLTDDILKEKDRRRLIQKNIAFQGVRFLKNVALYGDCLFFSTDSDIQCMMDTQTQDVTVFNSMEMPYDLLLSNPVTLDANGHFLTFVTAPNMENFSSMPEEFLQQYPFIPDMKDAPAMSEEDYWVVKGHIR